MQAWIQDRLAAIRYVRSAIEDLAFANRSSRESDRVGRRCCIEHDFAKGLEMPPIMGTEDKVEEFVY